MFVLSEFHIIRTSRNTEGIAGVQNFVLSEFVLSGFHCSYVYVYIRGVGTLNHTSKELTRSWNVAFVQKYVRHMYDFGSCSPKAREPGAPGPPCMVPTPMCMFTSTSVIYCIL